MPKKSQTPKNIGRLAVFFPYSPRKTNESYKINFKYPNGAIKNTTHLAKNTLS